MEEPVEIDQDEHENRSVVGEEDLPGILEAFIFASAEPLSFATIKEAFAQQGFEWSDEILHQSLISVMQKWSAPDRSLGQGLELTSLAGGYVFRTHPKYGSMVRAFLREKPQKLSPSQLEVLSIVAYRQPITRIEIDEIRGVDCSSAMRRLLGLKLIKILGKSQGLGRPLLYGTTKQFLEFFGLNSLHDLPTLKEYQELGKGETETIDPTLEEESLNLTDLFADRVEMFSEHTEKLSQEALLSLEKALGVVANAAQKLDIEKTLGLDFE